MNFAAPDLCHQLYLLTGQATCWCWDTTGARPVVVPSNGVYGNGIWPAYLLGDLYRMNPRATTWFKKETPRLGGMFS